MGSVNKVEPHAGRSIRKVSVSSFPGWNVLVALMVASALLAGCGGGSSGVSESNTFSLSGKISLAGGAPLSGVSVKLLKTSYIITPYSSAGGTFYSTKDKNGVESVKLETQLQTKLTDQNGLYSFTGVQDGVYTIQPTSGTYVFKWFQVPTRDNIGVLTITGSGIVYVYNPEGSGNKLSSDKTVIYNTGTPFTITGNVLNGQDFEASLPGSSSL